MSRRDASSPETMLRQAEELLSARRLSEALDRFQHAAAVGADADRCAAGRWMVHMLQGQFEQAWQQSDAIRTRAAPDPHRFWQGESLQNQRVILRCLHGFGDAVQFLRYAPRLRELAAELIVEVPPRLVKLAPCFDGVEHVITWGEAAPITEPEWDVQVEIMELPYLFRTQLHELALNVSYLKVAGPTKPPIPAASSFVKPLRVGLAWTAGHWNTTRSVSIATLKPILGVDGCEFWNLQEGAEQEAKGDDLTGAMRQENLSRDSIEGLAAVIAQLDLVITVDTLAAHLAGAMGVHAWVLLQHQADWRWMHARTDSPWYPSLRLFRQPAEGDWTSVIASVREALLQQSRPAGKHGMVALQ